MTDAKNSGRPAFPVWLAAAVGHVVLEASQCEDTLGELVALHRGVRGGPDFAWWTSGERLAAAVSQLDDPDAQAMAGDYRVLIAQRHQVVHGLWIGQGDTYLNMLRAKSTKKAPRNAEYEMGTSSEEDLQRLAGYFNDLERRAGDGVSRYMGITPQGS